jgi:hypothetical protein
MVKKAMVKSLVVVCASQKAKQLFFEESTSYKNRFSVDFNCSQKFQWLHQGFSIEQTTKLLNPACCFDLAVKQTGGIFFGENKDKSFSRFHPPA